MSQYCVQKYLWRGLKWDFNLFLSDNNKKNVIIMWGWCYKWSAHFLQSDVGMIECCIFSPDFLLFHSNIGWKYTTIPLSRKNNFLKVAFIFWFDDVDSLSLISHRTITNLICFYYCWLTIRNNDLYNCRWTLI